MKTKIALLCFFAILFFTNEITGQCSSGTLYPDNYYTSLNNGTLETVVTNAYAGEYAKINSISTNRTYTFTSSVTTDYITITDINNLNVLAHGPSGLTFTPVTNGDIRYYIHKNAQCITEDIDRVRYIMSTPASACGNPTGFLVSNITSNSCHIGWTAPSVTPSSGYEIYVNTINSTPLASVTVTGSVTTNAVEPLANLSPSTSYYYWVRSNCGSVKGVWVFGGGFTTNPFLACNSASYGLYPEATFTPACSGNPEPIAGDCFAGEYANINVLSNKQYTFLSSVITDHITITNAAGNVVLASGYTPLSWASENNSGVIRFFLHSNASCGNELALRTKYVTCNSQGCNNAPYGLYPTANYTPNCTGSTELIATDCYAGEYTNINILTSKQYTFSSSVLTDNVTITTADGSSVLASGPTPLTWLSGNNSGVIRFLLHTNASCGTSTNNRTKGISCISSLNCNQITSVTTTSTSNSAILDWTASTQASAYQYYVSTQNVTPTAGYTLVNTNKALCHNLLPSTVYYYWIRVNCSEGLYSEWKTGSFQTSNQLLCNGTSAGSFIQYPATTFTPSCTGNAETIIAVSYPGEFSNVAVLSNKVYTFSTTIATDYITITNADGNILLASGITPLTWSSGNNSGTIRYFIHTDASSCGGNFTSRVKSITCAQPCTGTPNIVPVFTQVAPICIGNYLPALPVDSNNGIHGSWSPAINNQVTTTYTFTPAPGQCALPTTMTINVMSTPNIVPTFEQIAPICAGGYIDPLNIDSTNGIGGTWTPALNNMATTTYTFTPDPGQCALPTTMTIVVSATPNIVPAFTQVAPICIGNYLPALPVDSNNGIHGSWSPAINNQVTTTYTFTPAPGQCALPTTMTINVMSTPNIVPTFEQIAPICAGGYIDPLNIDSTNGIGGTWTPALNNMATTTYTFTPDPGQCALPTTMTIVVSATPNILPVFTQVAPICIGNYLAALPVDSNNGIHGSWSPAINNQVTTTYTFTPAPGQCALPTTMTINVTSTPNIVPTFEQIAPICAGGYIDPLNIDSTNGIGGTWTPALNNMATTTYTFTPYPGQCALPTTMTIVVSATPNIVPTFTQVAPICIGNYLAALPVDSNNGIHGSWSPAINNQVTTTYTFTPAPGQCALPTTMTINVTSTPNIVPTFEQRPPICVGSYLAPLNIDSTNGINGTWTPALNNMATTTYTFTPDPGQCALPTTMTIVVSATPNILPSFTQVAPICAGSFLAPLAVDSNNGIHGSWSPAINNQVTTTYTFTPAPGQCALPTTMTITVSATPNIVPTFTQVAPICAGSFLAALPVDANNGVHGSWSPAINNMATTTYTFTPMQGQCAVSTTMTIQVTAPNTPIFTQVATVCAGSFMAPLPVYSNNGVQGTWSPALNNMATTTYTFTPVQGQCAVTTTMTINVTQIDNDVTIDGATITATMEGQTYQWYKCSVPNNILITGATSQSYEATENGYYRVKIDVAGCDSVFSDCVLIDILEAEDLHLSNLRIYPNPSNGQFVVETGDITVDKISVFDFMGRIVKSVKPSSFSTNLDIAGFADGIYLIKIENEGTETTKKLLLKK